MTKIVDNIEEITPLLHFTKDGKTCIMVQILERKKDGNNVKVHGSNRNRCVKTYHFYTKEQFEAKKDEIKDICQFFNARAYININPKPIMEILFKLSQMALDTIKCICSNDHPMSLVGLVDSAIAQTHAKKNEDTWVIDIDEEELQYKEDIINIIENSRSEYNNVIIKTINTVHGLHIITHRFDYQELMEKYPKKDFVKKNAYTLLYAYV